MIICFARATGRGQKVRVDPYFVAGLVDSLDRSQLNEQRLSSQLSSGVRVNSLSDDPLAAGENALLLDQIQRDDAFTQSSNLVQGQLQVADSTLGSVVNQLTQAISLATQANNGTLNDSQRQSIANQISGIRDEVMSLANASYQGRYIFAGAQTSSAPFSTSAASSPAVTTYSGDEGINFLQTPDGQSVQLNMPGDQIFTISGSNSVFAALNSLIDDFSKGASVAASVADTQSLSTALNFVSQQRVSLDNSLSRLTATSGAITNQKTQLIAAQTNLMQADLPTIATQLSLNKTQQTALESVIAQLGSGSLFDKL